MRRTTERGMCPAAILPALCLMTMVALLIVPAAVVGQTVPASAAPAVTPASAAGDGGGYRGPGPRVEPIREVDASDHYRPSSKPVAAPAAPLMEEGRRLLERTGRLVRRADGSYFQFDESELTLKLLPNHFMQRIEDVSDFGGRPMHFRVTTTVQSYRGQNYLLMTRAPEVVRSEVAADSAGRVEGGGGGALPSDLPSPAPVQSSPAGGVLGDDGGAASFPLPGDVSPVAEPDDEQRDMPPAASNLDLPAMPQLPSEVERQAPGAATADDGRGLGGSRDSRSAIGSGVMRRSAAGESILVQDGRWLVDREGRIDRVGEETRFIFDSGDEPMALLPNAKLERIEALSDYGRRGQRFRVSGSVTAYRGRNFLVLSKVLIIPKAIEDL